MKAELVKTVLAVSQKLVPLPPWRMKVSPVLLGAVA